MNCLVSCILPPSRTRIARVFTGITSGSTMIAMAISVYRVSGYESFHLNVLIAVTKESPSILLMPLVTDITNLSDIVFSFVCE